MPIFKYIPKIYWKSGGKWCSMQVGIPTEKKADAKRVARKHLKEFKGYPGAKPVYKFGVCKITL